MGMKAKNKKLCWICYEPNPISHCAVRVDGVVKGVICAKHTFHEAIFSHRGTGERLLITIDLVEDT